MQRLKDLSHRIHLEEMCNEHGSFEEIPWVTMEGSKMTLGTMTDDHVENCIAYHQQIVEDDVGMRKIIEACEYIVFMMKENRARRIIKKKYLSE